MDIVNTDTTRRMKGSDKIRILYIASLGHSGSTLLAQLIGSHSRLFSTGEIANLDDITQRCTCDAPSILECEFWLDVDAILTASTSRSLKDLRIQTDNTQRFREDNVALFKAISRARDGAILIDSSKSIDRLKRLMKIPELDIQPIFLWRHPAGVVYSNVRKGRNWFTYTIRHFGPSRSAVEFFRNVDHIKIQYQDLVENPKQVLSSVMAAAGEEFEDSQLLWTEGKRHDIGGNRMRFGTDNTIRVDNKWRAELNLFQRAVISALLSDFMIESNIVASAARVLKPLFGPTTS